MRQIIRSATFSLLLISVTAPAYAGLLLLAGESNIGNPIDGSSGASVVAGNATFMTNVLGSGTNVNIQQGSLCTLSCSTSVAAINTHYNSLGGVTSSIFAGSITAAALAGVDLLISALPGVGYTPAETGLLAGFLGSGGTVFFFGENSGLAASNAFINAALASLGSGMSLLDANEDAGFGHFAQILADLLTAGVAQFEYAAVNNVAGGTGLFATEQTSNVFVAYERTTQVVPEPATLALLGIAIAGLGFSRRRKLH